MIGVVILERGLTPKRLPRGMPRVLKAAWADVGVMWHKDMRPRHFTHRGAKEYGYRRRIGQDFSRSSKEFRRSYSGRKFRKYGHTFPLVYTGEVKENTRLRDVRSTSKGVRVVLRGANKLNFKPSGWSKTLREEMLTVSDREVGRIHKELDGSIEKGTKRLERMKTRRKIA